MPVDGWRSDEWEGAVKANFQILSQATRKMVTPLPNLENTVGKARLGVAVEFTWANADLEVPLEHYPVQM